MCSIPAIRLIVRVFNWLKAAFSIYVFGIGIFLASSSDFQQAFGVQYVSYGLSLIFLALLSIGMIFPFRYGAERHNRFLVMFVFVMETIVFAELINYGVILQSYTVPAFDKALQADCLRNTPLSHTAAECAPFFQSDRTAGFRLVWASYFTDKSQKSSFQVLTSIGNGLCCGFFQPFRCVENSAKYPSNRDHSGISGELLSAVVTCSTYANYYPERDNCKDVEDYSTDPPTIGGCRFDLAAGNCLSDAIEGGTYGCASFMEDWVVAQISPHAIMLIVCAMFNFLYMLLACCLWWKRKETDVFPEFMTKNKNVLKYRDVPDQFELAPHPGILVEEGFVPKESDTDTADHSSSRDGDDKAVDVESSLQSST